MIGKERLWGAFSEGGILFLYLLDAEVAYRALKFRDKDAIDDAVRLVSGGAQVSK